MTGDGARRKRAELLAKLGGITVELDAWEALSVRDGRLEKHNSQIRRVAGRLRPVAVAVRAAVEGGDGDWLALEEQVLDLHRVWGYFRDKLALREQPVAAAFLVLADEYAWACYEPAQKAARAAGDQLREPPLTYLTTVASPFSVSRQSAYGAAVGVRALTSRAARQLVERLPVPVIGVPWFQVEHLPEALVIGHEVGHLVLQEMIGLPSVEALVQTALRDAANALPEAAASLEDAATTWLPWAEEAFSDVYAALCAGPAYGRVLADFLAGPPAPPDPWYPPPAGRIALVTEALKQPPEAEDDAPERVVARALLKGPYEAFGGGPLTAVIDCDRQRDLAGPARDLLDGWDPTTRDIRTLVATAALAFAQDPDAYAARGLAAKVLARAVSIKQPGVRFRAGGEEADVAAIARADAQAAEELHLLLTGSAEAP